MFWWSWEGRKGHRYMGTANIGSSSKEVSKWIIEVYNIRDGIARIALCLFQIIGKICCGIESGK